MPSARNRTERGVEGEGREARNREAMACDGSGGDRELAQPGPSVTWWNERIQQKPTRAERTECLS